MQKRFLCSRNINVRIKKKLFETTTWRSSVDSLVSGFVLPFRTIIVLDMNPVAESTSVRSASSAAPEV